LIVQQGSLQRSEAARLQIVLCLCIVLGKIQRDQALVGNFQFLRKKEIVEKWFFYGTYED